MSQYYNPQRTRYLYDPDSKEPFRISRSKIDSFLNCPRCFYLDRRLGVGQPPGYPFTLNSAVDQLLKKEFDYHREREEPHPLMTKYKIDAVPFKHEKLEEWRDSLRRGVSFLHPDTNLVLTGGVDDVWINPDKELIVVDYKATAKNAEVTLDADWQIGYKRQMEIYQWLFRQNDFKVSDTGYFVYANGDTSKENFSNKLEFETTILPYTGSDNWVNTAVIEIHQCLNSDQLPESGEDCDFCKYREAVKDITKTFQEGTEEQQTLF